MTARPFTGPAPAARRSTAERPWKGISFLVLAEAGAEVGAAGLVRIPYRRRDGTLFRERYFVPSGHTWWGPGEGLIPFGLERLRQGEEAARRALLIAEGESDALALREAYAGVSADNPIRGYDTIGIPGAGTWRPEWRLLIEDYVLIYTLGDGDDRGCELTAAVCRAVPWARPVRLPAGQDARSLLQAQGPRALDAYLDAADGLAWLTYAFRRSRNYEEFAALCRGQQEAA